jgi:hypothetical protein
VTLSARDNMKQHCPKHVVMKASKECGGKTPYIIKSQQEIDSSQIHGPQPF